MQNYNLERTRAPRRRIPWWVFAGAIIMAGLLIWAMTRVLPGGKHVDSDADNAVSDALPVAEAETEDSGSAPPPPQATSASATTPSPVPSSAAASAPAKPSTSAVYPAGLQDAISAKESGDYGKAREIALGIWKTAESSALKQGAEAILNEVDVELVLSPRMMNEKVEYTVAPGDSLEKIARKFGTTIDLIKKSNNIKGSLIRVGDRLRIFQGKFKVTVSKSNNDLVVTMNDEFFKRYRVGTGAYNKTPVGDFEINDRIAQPTWWRPDGKAIPYGDPENLLGTHWLSINVKGYGLHGTWEPDTIGKQSSAGCVRLLNDDIEQLYTLLSIGTPVAIRD